MTTKLETTEVKVVARAGARENITADLFCCPACGFDEGRDPLFVVFQIVGQNHVHLQCGYCQETYCGGEQCSEPITRQQ